MWCKLLEGANGTNVRSWNRPTKEGESPVTLVSLFVLPFLHARVAQFGNAELIGRYPSAKAKYLPETDSEQVQ